MSVQGITGTSIMFLSPPEAVARISRSDSAIMHALDETPERVSSADTASIRFANLDYAHSRLRESGSELGVAQARQTAAQTAATALENIRSEMNQIESLLEEIGEGDFSASQLADAQLIIESRMARIDDIAATARYGGVGLLTGETVRVTTDAVTGEGFEVRYDRADSESLGLDAIDVVNVDVETNAEIISDALTSVENMEADVSAEMAAVGTVLEERVGDLQTAFESLMGAERLNTGEETRWLSAGAGSSATFAGNLGTLISPEALTGVLPSLELSPEVVSNLLA